MSVVKSNGVSVTSTPSRRTRFISQSLSRAGADEATAPESLQFEGPVVAGDRRTANHARIRRI